MLHCIAPPKGDAMQCNTQPDAGLCACFIDNATYPSQVRGYVGIADTRGRIHNAHIHARLDGMVEENSVHGFADIVIAQATYPSQVRGYVGTVHGLTVA